MTQKRDTEKAKLTAKGYTGTVQEQEKAHWKVVSGGAVGTENDVENKALTVLGYTGTINDKRAALNKAAGSENAYWANLP